MIHLATRRILPIAGIFILVMSLITTSVTHAAGNQLYVTPDTSQLNVGGTVTVSVRGYIESNSTGNAVGTVTYPVGQLRVLGTSVTESDYNAPNISLGSGTVGFSATSSKLRPIKIFSITFQATAPGSAVVGFSGNSNINQTATIHKTGTYAIVAPTPTPTPTPSPSPKPTPTPTPTPTEPQATPETIIPAQESDEDVTVADTTGLISDVTSTGKYTEASIKWSMSAANGNSQLLYGTSSQEVTTKAEVVRAEDGTYSATIPNTKPGQRYFYTINGTGDDGKTGTYSSTVSTLGYPITIKLTQNGAIATGADIQIGRQRYATSRDGIITLALAEGTYSIRIAAGTSTLSEKVVVAKKPIPQDGSAPEKQIFTFDIPAAAVEKEPLSPFVFVGVMVGGAVIITVSLFAYITIRRRRYETGSGYTNTAATSVVINDGYDWRAEQLQQQQAENMPIYGQTNEQPYINNIQDAATASHDNSVYIDEAEPKDMYELAREQSAAQASPQQSTTLRGSEWPQNPSPPHSTRL